ncbi:hypothetical protein ncot_06300 [Nocardioides sp. JQ2195]|uniref:hypothetical protein n=1 Tax=Nocardioides sp. JQ2195 TaxID=2592334 RepID=UPI00143E5CF3|nr:hypothetical protein [Nocardioides sp. JQ2195]QIX26258.1 hypothetical protein ncot_06300 [Nocardioides sp. JQ2195]
MPIPSHPVSRRTTLAAAPLLLAAGCRWGPAEEAATPPEQDVAEGVPDAEQVDAAVAAITEAQQFVSAVADKHIGLSGPLAELTALHTAHLGLLEPHRTASPTTAPDVPKASGVALDAVRRRETTLQATLSGLAADVSSGTLARTLAAMAAGVAQHRQVLPASRKASDA